MRATDHASLHAAETWALAWRETPSARWLVLKSLSPWRFTWCACARSAAQLPRTQLPEPAHVRLPGGCVAGGRDDGAGCLCMCALCVGLTLCSPWCAPALRRARRHAGRPPAAQGEEPSLPERAPTTLTPPPTNRRLAGPSCTARPPATRAGAPQPRGEPPGAQEDVRRQGRLLEDVRRAALTGYRRMATPGQAAALGHAALRLGSRALREGSTPGASWSRTAPPWQPPGRRSAASSCCKASTFMLWLSGRPCHCCSLAPICAGRG